ncbi:hypothetical protein JL722_9747 [Aureococcus anophagefferens]|nr:hypothetical protein JL722_9747 [Aureococcus anophagefferens]
MEPTWPSLTHWKIILPQVLRRDAIRVWHARRPVPSRGGRHGRPAVDGRRRDGPVHGCTKAFDSGTWRHHCRRCGMIFCDHCSRFKCLIHPAEAVYPPDWDSMLSSFDPREPLRVCATCHRELAPSQATLRQTTANAAQPTEVDRDTMERYLNVPIQFDMRSEILKATHTLLNFCDDNAIEGSDSVPRELIASAWGLAFVTTMQAGFFFSARVGTGLVVARTPDGGWSAPSAVCTAGAGWGLQIGGEVTDMLVVLNSQDAVDAFASTAQLSLGTELSLALGPMGRSAETNMTAGDSGVSAVFSYAHSKGFFVGIALHACVILARPDCNEKFYGDANEVATILSGAVPRPVGASPLYDALDEVLRGERPFYDHGGGRADWARQNGAALGDADGEFGCGYDEDVADPFAPRDQHETVFSAARAVRVEQIDRDLALALSARRSSSAREEANAVPPPPPPDHYRPPDHREDADSSFFGRWGSTGDAAPRDDAWADERRERLSSLADETALPTEELKACSLRGAARAPPAPYDDELDELEI